MSSPAPGTTLSASAAPPPRKGAYTKHAQNLHKDQLTKLQTKHSQEVDLLEDIRSFMKQKAAIEKHYGDALLKLSTSHQNHRIAAVPDIQRGDEEQQQHGELQEVNVYTLWKKFLDENEKVAKAKLAAVQIFHDEVEKDAKAVRSAKQAKGKKTFERLNVVQKDLQATVAELDRTKRIYFSEETEAEDVHKKARDAEDKAKGRKKDMLSIFQSKTTLRKHAGLLSAKQEESEIKSTGARNDYILSLASANAHQDRYYKHDLADTMRYLEGEFYEKISSYLGTVSRTDLVTCQAVSSSSVTIRDLAQAVTRFYNYECYTKVYPSLGQHITYEHEAPANDDVRTITPSEHDGGYSLNYEARQNASKLNQAVKTIKAYHKRIQACHYHKSKGLKHEPNDTGGPDLDTKINELTVAIHNAERERAKADARLNKLREGGITVDEYIDAFVYSYDPESSASALQPPAAAQQPANNVDEQKKQPAEEDWPSEDAQPVVEQQQQQQEEAEVAVEAAQRQQSVEAANTGWGDDAANASAPEEDWAAFDQQQQQVDRQQSVEAGGGDNWATSGGWASFDQQNSVEPAVATAVDASADNGDEAVAAAAAGDGRAVPATALYTFEAQNRDELTVTENEALTILLDECDEEGWLMGINSSGEKGYVPQNYVDFAGNETAQQQAEVGEDETAAGGYGVERQDSYGSSQSGFQRQDSYGSQQGQQVEDAQGSNGSWGVGQYYGVPGTMEPILEQAEVQQQQKPSVPAAPVQESSPEEDSSSVDETESCALPPGLPPPGPPPPGPPPEPPGAPCDDDDSESKLSRPPSISLSASIDSKDFCRALYDYDATGSDEISFEQGDNIRILKKCPNGVDDGWWLGERNGRVGLFPSVVVEELEGDESGDSPDASSITSPPSMAPPSFSPPHASPSAPPPAVPPPMPPPVPPAKPPPPAATPAKKPVVPCVQISVDEVPDIPADDDDDVDAPPPSDLEKVVEEEPQPAGLNAMEIVVTCPTPTVQSPESESTTSQPPPPPPPLKQEEQRSKSFEEDSEMSLPEAPVAVVVSQVSEEEEEKSSSVSESKQEQPPTQPEPAPPAAESTSEKQDTEETKESATSEKADGGRRSIERTTSSDNSSASSVSSIRKSSASAARKGSSSPSSASESAGPEDNPGSSGDDDSEMPLPPEQLELRQLKKLDSMKESTA